MPASPTSTTSKDTANRVRSTTPVISHTSCSATPGRMAVSGSAAYSFTARCTASADARFFNPTNTAVMPPARASGWPG